MNELHVNKVIKLNVRAREKRDRVYTLRDALMEQ